MGDILILNCPDCGYRDELSQGHGMKFTSLQNVISAVSKSRRDEVLKLLKREHVSDIEYGYEIFVCPECKLQGSRFDYQIEYGEDQVYQPYFLCSRCHTKLKNDPDPYQDRPCPYCGSDKVLHSFGLWD
jgi:predicted RNA-binding Zn-ribbon protein involved in translation (DUF1610 family)